MSRGTYICSLTGPRWRVSTVGLESVSLWHYRNYFVHCLSSTSASACCKRSPNQIACNVHRNRSCFCAASDAYLVQRRLLGNFSDQFDRGRVETCLLLLFGQILLRIVRGAIREPVASLLPFLRQPKAPTSIIATFFASNDMAMSGSQTRKSVISALTTVCGSFHSLSARVRGASHPLRSSLPDIEFAVNGVNPVIQPEGRGRP